jgi:hypothetical protein
MAHPAAWHQHNPTKVVKQCVVAFTYEVPHQKVKYWLCIHSGHRADTSIRIILWKWWW